MKQRARAGSLLLGLMAGGAGCAEDNPLHGPPRDAHENEYRDLSMRQPRRRESETVTVTEALAAWHRGARTESLVRAVAALETGDRDPSLLGLAAAASGAVRPRVRSEQWLPGCQSLWRTLRRSSSLCVGVDEAWVREGAGPWRTLGEQVRDALWTEGHGVVLLDSGRVETLDGTVLGNAAADATLLSLGDAVLAHAEEAVRSVQTDETVLDGVRAVARARSGSAWAALLDGRVIVQDTAGQQTLETHASGDRLALSPLGSHVAQVSPEGVVPLTGPAAGVAWAVTVEGPVAVSERGDLAVVTAGGDVAWRTPEGAVHRFPAQVRSLGFDSGSLVVHTENDRLRTLDPPHAALGVLREAPTMALHRVRGRVLQVLQDGQWQVLSANRRRVLSEGHLTSAPTAAALHPALTHVALASAEGVSLVSLEGPDTPSSAHAWVAPRAVAWGRRGDREDLSVLDSNGLHWLDGTPVRTADMHGLDSLAWRGALAWVSGDLRVERWPRSPGALAQQLTVSGATAAVPLPPQDAVVFSTPEATVLQDTDGKVRWSTSTSIGAVRSAATPPKGGRLALGGASGEVAVLDLSGTVLLETPPLAAAEIRQVVWTADGRLLALDGTGTVHLVDATVLDADPAGLWGQLAWSEGLALNADGTVVDAPWRVSPPALADGPSVPALP